MEQEDAILFEERVKDEYEMQHFGMTGKHFASEVKTIIMDTIEGAVLGAFADFVKDMKMNSNPNKEISEEDAAKIDQVAEAYCKELQSLVEEHHAADYIPTMFEIPENVLLEEDAVQAKSGGAEESNDLDNEIEELLKQLQAERYKELFLEQELKEGTETLDAITKLLKDTSVTKASVGSVPVPQLDQLMKSITDVQSRASSILTSSKSPTGSEDPSEEDGPWSSEEDTPHHYPHTFQ